MPAINGEFVIYLASAMLLALCALAVAALIRARRREGEAERRFRVYFERAAVGMAVTLPDRRWIAVNPAFCRMLGYPADALLNKRWDELTHPDDLAASQALFEATLRGEQEGYEQQKRYIHASGEVRDVSISAQLVHKADGSPDYFLLVVEDISQRQAAERLLALQAQRATALLTLPQQSHRLDEPAFVDCALDIAKRLTASRVGFVHFVDPVKGRLRLVACSMGEGGDTRWLGDYDCPLSRAGVLAEVAAERQPLLDNDFRGVARVGAWPASCPMPNRLLVVPVIEEGVVRLLVGVGDKAAGYTGADLESLQQLGSETWRNVCQRRIEQALQIANQVVNASPVICFRWAAAADWPVVFVSENVQRLGYTAEELQAGRPVFAEMIHPDDLARVGEEVRANTAAGVDQYRQEYRIVTRENRIVWVVDRTNIRRDAEGKAIYYDGVLTDITESKQQQLALAENLAEQKKLNKLLEEARNQLLQSEKMASIGQLAAGVAHELNNPIGFVHSNLGTLDGYLRDLMDIIDAYEALASSATDNPLHGRIAVLKDERDFDFIRKDLGQLLQESKDGLSRVRKIVLDLKNFSHVGEQEWQWADLHQGLDSTLNIVWNELKYKCKVIKAYGDLPEVFCMISQLNQVFMNLLVNAGHAIEQQGQITIRTSRRGEREVCVEISDTGQGIPPELLNRIFEPFFTTKPIGKGTGLGLSLAYGIVGKHHGHIEVDSTPGQGTTFRVILPINQGADDNGAIPEASA